MADTGINTNRMTNANIYVNGNSKLGQAEEVDSPVLKWKQSEHKSLGMVGTIELPTGIDKLELKIKWSSYYGATMKEMANPTKVVAIQVRGNLETWTSEGLQDEVPYVIFASALPKDFPTGNFKQHDNTELESMLNVLSMRVEVDGDEILHFDSLANIYKVNGEDILANFKNNLGI